MYETWHALHPTALGNCGCPGLCPRGTDRSLCLGCRYHVEDPEKLGATLAWQASYARQAELLEAQGNAIDARQARIKVQFLDDMISVMRLQLEEEVAGRYIPVFKILPSPYRNMEARDEKELEDHDALFLTRTGKPYSQSAYYHHWNRLFALAQSQFKKEEVVEFTSHDLRHIHVTRTVTKNLQGCAWRCLR